MYKIRFKPFIGEKYKSQNFKILVLGESHYLGKSDMNAFKDNRPGIEFITKNLVKGYLNYKQTGNNFSRWMNTFTKFTNAINGKNSSIQEILAFWNSSSFYNYVQAPTKGPRIKPTQKEFNLSIDAFKEVTNKLKPSMIFIWGSRLWDNFPKDIYFSEQKESMKIHYLKLDENIPIMVVPHPSSSKFNKSTYKEIADYINTVKNGG